MVSLPFVPSGASTREFEVRETEIPFGDGFAAVKEEFNPIRENWGLTFAPMTLTDGQTLIDFFKTNRGITLVQWTPPGAASAINFRMKGPLRVSYTGPTMSVSFMMKQEYRSV